MTFVFTGFHSTIMRDVLSGELKVPYIISLWPPQKRGRPPLKLSWLYPKHFLQQYTRKPVKESSIKRKDIVMGFLTCVKNKNWPNVRNQVFARIDYLTVEGEHLRAEYKESQNLIVVEDEKLKAEKEILQLKKRRGYNWAKKMHWSMLTWSVSMLRNIIGYGRVVSRIFWAGKDQGNQTEKPIMSL